MNRHATPRGFTLLELLVAVTITLLLAGLTLMVTTGTLNLWRRTQETFTAGTQAKLALDLIERDLQSAICRQEANGTVWLATDVINVPGTLAGNHGWKTVPLMKPATAESQRLVPDPVNGLEPGIADARFGLSGAWLRFIAATIESENERALPRAIAYQVARRPVSGSVAASNPAEVRYSLFRTAISSQTTFADGYNVATAYAAALTNPGTGDDALATNVVDFGVWLYVRDAAGALRRIYPAYNADRSHAATDALAPGDANRFPVVADVMVRILTDEGARILDAMERANGTITRPGNFGNDAEWWWAVVEANSRVYVRRVEVKGSAP
ncbi:MAG: prepilin-type N-terminal cleavage/methylation domain-containing protein [Lacunisphaera sp.]|nr:prepilin-type N-terminal cleavage/methylation domain-containing protein [Lacunisphaera sp.]